MTDDKKREHIKRLLNQTEISDKNARLDAYRSILYIAQSLFGECDNLNEFNSNLTSNIILLYECDTFNVFIDLLYFEVE